MDGFGFLNDMNMGMMDAQQDLMQQQMMNNQMMNDQMMLENQMMLDNQMMNNQMMNDGMMLQQSYQSPVMTPRMNVYAPQISYDRYGMPKIHKKQALDLLKFNLQNSSGTYIQKITKIDETPDTLRHCCAECGISFLQQNAYNIAEAGISIPYYYCFKCGSLYIYDDFM